MSNLIPHTNMAQGKDPQSTPALDTAMAKALSWTPSIGAWIWEMFVAQPVIRIKIAHHDYPISD